MEKNKKIYHSPLHDNGRSHDVIIVQHAYNHGNVCGSVKIKMTYEAYNGVEKFTGEIFNNNKWEHLFQLMDLGIFPDKSSYDRDISIRKKRCENLQINGFTFIDMLY